MHTIFNGHFYLYAFRFKIQKLFISPSPNIIMTETKFNALKLGLAGGIVGAFVVFCSTLLGVYGFSQAADSMASTM